MSANTSLDLAIIIVTWNTRQLVLNALYSVFADLANTTLTAEIWVVDNQSHDGTADAIRRTYPQVHMVESGANLGFAKGNNVALRALGFRDIPQPAPHSPKAVFLLNPDTILKTGAIKHLYTALFNLPHAGVVGAQLKYEDDTFQHGAFHFPTLIQLLIDLLPLPPPIFARVYESPLNGRYPRQQYAAGKPFAVDYTLGATMMLRREAIEASGLFDEQFHMYCEEIDWSKRIRQANFEIYCVPQAVVYHLEGRSSRQIRAQTLINLWTSRLQLWRKHYPPLTQQLARWFIRMGMRYRIRQLSQIGFSDSVEQAALLNAYQWIIDLTKQS